MAGRGLSQAKAAARGLNTGQQAVTNLTFARSVSTRPRDTSTEAESSTNASSSPAAGRYSRRSDESAEEAWKRNINEVRSYRRGKEAQRAQTGLYLPAGISPPRPNPLQTSLSTLMASGAALGHSTALLSPPYIPYVYGSRSGLSIIDLDQTLPILRRTAALVRDVVKADGVVLIIGTRGPHARGLEKAKERLGDNGFIVKEWLAGTLTNAETFFGLKPMRDGSYVPDLVILLNPSENLGAIRECTLKNIPTVGIVDTETDPRVVTYPIPANMESIRTVELVLGTLSLAGQEGRRLRAQEAQRKAQPVRR